MISHEIKLSNLSKLDYDYIIKCIKDEFGEETDININFSIMIYFNNEKEGHNKISSNIKYNKNIKTIKTIKDDNRKIVKTVSRKYKDKILREDLKTFLRSHIVYNKNSTINIKVLYKSYINWCINNNKKYIYMSNTSFKTNKFDEVLKGIDNNIWRTNDLIHNALYCTVINYI